MAKKSIDKKRINREADALAKEFHLSAYRVREVSRLLHERNLIDPEGLLRKSIFGLALEHTIISETLKPPYVLKIFLHRNLVRLSHKHEIFSHLKNKKTPFYTLGELSKLFSLFLDYFESNKSHLLKTGYPLQPFGNYWLDRYLNQLYPVKSPLYHPIFIGSDFSQHSQLNEWVLEPAGMNPKLDYGHHRGKTYAKFGYRWKVDEKHYRYKALTTYGKPLSPCRYEKASYIPGLRQRDETRLVKMRKGLFALRILTLRRLIDAISERDGGDLLADWYKDLTRTFGQDKIEFLEELDDVYKGLQPSVVRNSSLINQILVIFHVEKEITIGAYCKTKESLNKFPVDSYWDSLNTPWHLKSDTVLDEYDRLEAEEQEFFDNKFLPKVSEIMVIWKGKIENGYSMKKSESNDLSLEIEYEGLEFFHTVDYREVTIRGKTFTLTKSQAKVIRYLTEARKRGKPWIAPQEMFKSRYPNDLRKHKLCWIFRDKDREKFRELIKYNDNRRLICLNLSTQ